MARLSVPSLLHKGWLVTLIVTAGIGALGVWAQNAAIVGVNYDDGIYAMLARSLVEGDGYRLTYLPDPVPGVKYPPVYPLSLAPLWVVAASPAGALGAMKVASGVYLGLAAGLFLLLLLRRRLLVEPVAIVVALVAFASGSMMLISNGVLSEPLFLAILFATLLIDDVEAGLTPARLVAIGLLAGLAALTRTVGIALVAAVVIGVAVRGGWRKTLVSLAASLALLGPWALFTFSHAGQVPDVLLPRYGSYLELYLANVGDSPGAVFEVAFVNLNAILRTVGANLVPGIPAALRPVAGVLILGFAALGSRHAFRTAPSLVLYHWLYLGLIAFWTFPPFRFLLALLPITLALAAVAFERAARRLSRSGEEAAERGARHLGPIRVVAAVLVILFLANLAYGEARAIGRRVWDGAQLAKSAVSQEVLAWVNLNTEADDVVAYEFDPLIALHTGRRAAPNNYEPVHAWYRSQPPAPELLARLFVEMGVDIVAVRRDVPAAAAPIDALIERHPQGLKLVAVTSRGALIFRTDLRVLSLPAGTGAARTRTGGGGE